MSYKLNNDTGYTLTEMMIVVAIIGALISIGPTIMNQMTRFFQMNKARTEIQRDGRTSLDIINRNLRQATAASVVVSSLDSTQPPYSMISFTSIDDTIWSFYQQNNKLMMTQNGSSKTLCENLRYIGFTYPRTDETKILSVSITLEKQTYNAQTKALQLSVEKVRIMND